MAPVTSMSSSQPQTLEADQPGEESNLSAQPAAPALAPVSREADYSKHDEMVYLPLKQFSRMQILAGLVQIETKSYVQCANKGCSYISLTLWDMAFHLASCEGPKGNDNYAKCHYCPHGTKDEEVLIVHMKLSHPYAPEVKNKKCNANIMNLKKDEVEAFLTSQVAKELIRAQWRICHETKGYIMCLARPCSFVTSLIPEMEDHFTKCSPEIWDDLRFSCKKCPGRTFSKESLEAHNEECHSSQNVTFNTVQPEAKRFWELSLALYGVSKCVSMKCKFTACNISELSRHYRYCRVPHIENFEVCEYCGGWCETSADIYHHVRTLHGGINSDKIEESLAATEHLQTLKRLIDLDLNSAHFPWLKVMSFGGEATLNRLVEGIDEVPAPTSRKKGSVKSAVKPEPKKSAASRRMSARASEIDLDVSLHEIKAEELANPDKTYLEDLGQAIEAECMETPKIEIQVSVGDQSWTVEAPSLETASEVITRRMPCYSVKNVLAQSIEDSLNLLKLEAMVTSIECLSTKPYKPPKALDFVSSSPRVQDSLRKKYDIIRKGEIWKQQTFMAGDSFMETPGPSKISEERETNPRKRNKQKILPRGVRPWQSLARIKQNPKPPNCDKNSQDASQKNDPNVSVWKTGPNDQPAGADSNMKTRKVYQPLTIRQRAGKNLCPNLSSIQISQPFAHGSNRLDMTVVVRDVSVQHGSSAIPHLTEQLLCNNRYNRATLLIGYPYSVLRQPSNRLVHQSTQTALRNYPGKLQSNQVKVYSAAPFRMGSRVTEKVKTSEPVSSGSLPLPKPATALPSPTNSTPKRLVVVGSLAPVDASNPMGAQILKETRAIGDLKNAVMKNLMRLDTKGGPSGVIRVVTRPNLSLSAASPVQTRPGASPVQNLRLAASPRGPLTPGVGSIRTLRLAVRPNRTLSPGTIHSTIRNLVPCSKPFGIRAPPTLTQSSAPSTVTAASNVIEFSNSETVPPSSASTNVKESLAVPITSSTVPVAMVSSNSLYTMTTASSKATTNVSTSFQNIDKLDLGVCPDSNNAPKNTGPSASRVLLDVAVAVSCSGTQTCAPSPSVTSTCSFSSFKKTLNLKTYSQASKLKSMLRSSKRPRLEIPDPSPGCSKELSVPEHDRISPISFEVPILPPNKSVLFGESSPISDYFFERKPEESTSTVKPSSRTYSKDGTVFQSSSAFKESYDVNLRLDVNPTPNECGIFENEAYDETISAAADTKEEGVSSTSGDLNDPSNGDVVPMIFESIDDALDNCNPHDASITCGVVCESSTTTGGLYNDKFPWEVKNVLMNPSIEEEDKPAPAPQTSLHMEVDEDPCPGFQPTKQPDENDGEPLNHLAEYLTNHDRLQVRNEPLVCVMRIFPDPSLESQAVNEEERFKDLVHYLTHYNRLQVRHEPMVFISNKSTHDVPSTSTSSRSSRRSGSSKNAAQDGKPVNPSETDKAVSVELPPKKRQRKSAAAASADSGSDFEKIDTIKQSTQTNPEVIDEVLGPKKRGRKSKTELKSSDSKQEISRDNGEDGEIPPKKPGRKPKNPVTDHVKNTEPVSKPLKAQQKSTTVDDSKTIGSGSSMMPGKEKSDKSKNCTTENNKQAGCKSVSSKGIRKSSKMVNDSTTKSLAKPDADSSIDQEQGPSKTEDCKVTDGKMAQMKGSGKKAKDSKPTDVLLEMEVEPGEALPRMSLRRRAPPKKPVPTDSEDVSEESRPTPPKPKRKSRYSKRQEVDYVPVGSQDDDGKRFLCDEDDEDNVYYGRLIPAYDRIIFNSTLPNPNKMVTCAICNDNMTAIEYKQNHLYKHNHICWLTNEEPMDLEDELTLERHLYKVYCHLRQPFVCEVCTKTVKSAKGFLSHKRFCGKSVKERTEKMVACNVCSRLLKPTSLQQHIQNHHFPPNQKSPVKAEPTESTAGGAADCSLKKISDGVMTLTVQHINPDEEKLAADSETWIRRSYSTEKRRITQSVKGIFNAFLERDGVCRCLNPGCDRTDEDIKKMMDHYRNCSVTKLDYKCKICSFMDNNEYVMIHHVRTLHAGMSIASNRDRKAVSRSETVISHEFNGKCLPYLKAAEGSSRSFLYLQPALLWTYRMRKEFMASGVVRSDLSIDDIEMKSFEDFPSHVELRDKSMRMAISSNSPEWIKLEKLTSREVSDHAIILYTGGVVRCLDWFPSTGEQYLIVAIGSIKPETINVKTIKTGPGHVQIWSAGKLENFGGSKLSDGSLKFEYALCHDFGEVWDLECCPGGEPTEKRLGLVALATSSGKALVYAVPTSESHHLGEAPRATKPEPTLVLDTGLHGSFQVSKVAWSKVKPHRLIAAGYTNGMVAIWDLTTTSVLLKSGNTLLPFKMFHPHFTTITGLSFSPVHEYYVTTSCADKSNKFYNLEDTSISHVEFNRGLFMDVAWLTHWMSAVAAIDDNTTLGTTTAVIHPLRNFIYQAHPSITQAESCCLSVSVNDWMNAFLCSYDSGQVVLTFARKHCHMLDDRKKGHAQLIIPEFHNFNPSSSEMIDCQSYAATSENFGIIFNFDFSPEPMTKLKPVPLSDVTYFPSTAANRACWNPNVNSFLTMAIGYHSGFVVLGRLQLSSLELSNLSLMMGETLQSACGAPSGRDS